MHYDGILAKLHGLLVSHSNLYYAFNLKIKDKIQFFVNEKKRIVA